MTYKSTYNDNKNQINNLNSKIEVLNERLETKMFQISILKKNISRLNDELYFYRSNTNDELPNMEISNKKTFILLGFVIGLIFLIGFVTGYNLRNTFSHIWPLKNFF